MRLDQYIENETDAEFERRVETFYCYTFLPGENWCLFDEFLIVAHPDRPPKMISQGGHIEVLNPNDLKW